MMQISWRAERPLEDAAVEAEILEHTAIDIYQWFREVCSTELINEAWLNQNSLKQQSRNIGHID